MSEEITNDLAIDAYIHCGQCIDEWKADDSVRDPPRDFARLSIGFTPLGIQVWCVRHNCNVMHVDFQDQCHPANTDRKVAEK